MKNLFKKFLSLFTKKKDNWYKAEVGRNEPCLCGSGKKAKKCHGSGKIYYQLKK